MPSTLPTPIPKRRRSIPKTIKRAALHHEVASMSSHLPALLLCRMLGDGAAGEGPGRRNGSASGRSGSALDLQHGASFSYTSCHHCVSLLFAQSSPLRFLLCSPPTIGAPRPRQTPARVSVARDESDGEVGSFVPVVGLSSSELTPLPLHCRIRRPQSAAGSVSRSRRSSRHCGHGAIQIPECCKKASGASLRLRKRVAVPH